MGWTTHPLVGGAYMGLAATLVDRGMLAEGEQWLERADPILARAPEPSASVGLRHVQGMLAMVPRPFEDALAAFRDGERLVEVLRAPHVLGSLERPWQLRARLGSVRPMPSARRWSTRRPRPCGATSRPGCHLAVGDAADALAAVAPVHARRGARVPRELPHRGLGARRARAPRARRPRARPRRSTEHALALSEPDGSVGMILTIPGVRDLLRDHPTHRTAHGAHLQLLRDLLAGVEPEPTAAPATLQEPLKERELAVLRFLSTNLTAGGDRQRAVPVGAHGQDPHAQALREARRPHPGRGGAAGPRPRAARARAPESLSGFTLASPASCDDPSYGFLGR